MVVYHIVLATRGQAAPNTGIYNGGGVKHDRCKQGKNKGMMGHWRPAWQSGHHSHRGHNSNNSSTTLFSRHSP